MSDNVNRPAHYTQWPIEAIVLTEREDFLYGNVLKYTLRAGSKEGSSYEEDMAKAVWYATRFVSNIAKVLSVRDGLDCLLRRSDEVIAYLTSRQEDCTAMRVTLSGRLNAVQAAVEKEAESWDAV